MWEPPLDPAKPSCPYFPGFRVAIRSHIPPPPFGGNVYRGAGVARRAYPHDRWLHEATQSEHVVACPPLETEAPTQVETAELTVTKALAIGNARGPQLVVCAVAPPDAADGKREPFAAVAKIYDALYYSFANTFASGVPEDVTCEADRDYSREAAAYEHLRDSGRDGAFAPRYFGSWTFILPIREGSPHPGQRPVRMILMEHLEGPSLRQLFARNQPGVEPYPDATHYDEEYRLEVLARILDALVRQIHVGLSHGHLTPGNIVLVPRPLTANGSPGPGHTAGPSRVVLLDYTNSVVWSRTRFGSRPSEDLPLPPNPVETWWQSWVSTLATWAGAEWDRNPQPRREWLLRQFGGKQQRDLYAPITSAEVLEFASSEGKPLDATD
ncbi:hypothetical protein DL765_000250 [Monosporascus sp. GIB2]|nr:hypothetical protein DL765_000250 [Monosporascus sp. GIB2]